MDVEGARERLGGVRRVEAADGGGRSFEEVVGIERRVVLFEAGRGGGGIWVEALGCGLRFDVVTGGGGGGIES